MTLFSGKGVSVVALRPVLEGLVRHGADPTSLLAATKIDEGLLQDPEARVPDGLVRELWDRAVLITKDPDFGLHAAETVNADSFDVVGYISKSSATVGNAVRRAVRYVRLIEDSLELELVVEGDKARLEYAAPLGLPRAAADYRVALLVRLARLLSAREMEMRAVRFQHARPLETSEYVRVLGVLPSFGCARDGIVFSAALLDVPMKNADEQLCAILERQAEQLLQKLPRLDGFRGMVRREIAAELQEGEVSLTRVADRLGMSARTLRRRLHEEGTSHQQLLDELRHHLALRYLNEDGRTVCEAAFLLGFADSSAFSKAFRRWTGESPGENRKSSRPSNPRIAPRPASAE